MQGLWLRLSMHHVQVLVNVARRLADLHDAGWVHRDLKPGNVLWLPRKQRWTLIDFALAAAVGSDASVVFTPSYAAPEIIHAAVDKRPSVKATAAMDSWSLGVMAFELLTGCTVFDHQEPDMKKVCMSRIAHRCLLTVGTLRSIRL